MLLLERKSKDPSRLGNYKALAQEEKDRKRVNTRLPKIKEKLFAAIESYEVEHGCAFLVGGVPFKDYWDGKVRTEVIVRGLYNLCSILTISADFI
jgi:hypothetical protein